VENDAESTTEAGWPSKRKRFLLGPRQTLYKISKERRGGEGEGKGMELGERGGEETETPVSPNHLLK